MSFLSPDGRSVLIFRDADVSPSTWPPGGWFRSVGLRGQRVRGVAAGTVGTRFSHQVFSPDGNWFAISSSERNPCARRVFALDVRHGGLMKLPVSEPAESCYLSTVRQTDSPNTVRWVAE